MPESFIIKIEKIRLELLANEVERNKILFDLARIQAECRHLSLYLNPQSCQGSLETTVDI